MDNSGRDERNQKRCKVYAEMDAHKKAAMLAQRRMRYTESKGGCGHYTRAREGVRIGAPVVGGLQGIVSVPQELPPISPLVVENSTDVSSNTGTSQLQSALARSGGPIFRAAHIDRGLYRSGRVQRPAMDASLLGRSERVHGVVASNELPFSPDCMYCGAKRFYHEPPGFCCSEGEISIVLPLMPAPLARLFTSSDPECDAFRKYVRTYNNNLTFTTFSARKDAELMKNRHGVYTFKVQGKVHHYLASFTGDVDRPTGVQFYFYDPEVELKQRMDSSSRFSREVMLTLMQVLANNPYTCFLRHLKDLGCVDDYRLYLVTNPRLDQRMYNEPTCADVCGIVCVDGDDNSPGELQIQIYTKNVPPYRICHNYGCYDCLQYPLLFPRGEIVWHCSIEKLPPNMRKRGYRCRDPLANRSSFPAGADELLSQEQQAQSEGIRKRNTVSCREYYCYKLQIRDDDRSMVLHTGRLFQQYIVDMFVKIETSRLEYMYKHQREIRTESMQGILDNNATGNSSSHAVGRKVILPPSFVGGPRDMKKHYLDAMCLVQNFGRPDFFLTMTCNPAWPEITKHLLPHELAQNRPDLLARVFKAKLEMLKKELLKDNAFGIPVASVYSIEFQKRGLPHAHLLLIMDRYSRPLNPEAYDRLISAELPDPSVNPRLYDLVLKHMVHGPCGVLNPQCHCMRDSKCKNKYPKEFLQYTTHVCNSYPHYRRRDTGISAKVRGYEIDNRWIVPYNPYLLERYDFHINVEICSTIKLVKYIYKYIYKGPDRVAFQLGGVIADDEIKEYHQGRWVGPPEAAWRIYAFDLFEIHPSVVDLQLHLPGNYMVSFGPNQDLESIAGNEFLGRTMLTQFFETNRTNARATSLNLLYRDFSKYFVWDTGKRPWSDRKKGKVVGRVVSTNPREGERYYLHLLLSHVLGRTCYQDLLTVNGHLHNTFREAALACHLLASDNDLDMCLDEVILQQMSRQLRQLFASVLVFCAPSNPRRLWEKYADSLCEDYTWLHTGLALTASEIRMKGLQDLSMLLSHMGRQLSDYGLGPEADLVGQGDIGSKEMEYEMSIQVDDSDLLSAQRLNEQQQRAYSMIMEKVMKNEPVAFFVDGPGGTGKTYLYRAILAALRSQRYIALATTSSGVAACVLPGGRTAHSRFKLPLHNDDHKIANVSKKSTTARLLREAKVIIWDEAPMAHRESIEAFSEMLKDITEVDQPFGSKVVVFGGDFRQVLPVVTNATRQEQLDASLFSSPLWPALIKLRLTENMRARADPFFMEFLMRIGDGTEHEDENGNISLPVNMVIPFREKGSSLQELITFVYPDLGAFASDHESAMSRALLAPTNDCVDDINEAMLHNIPGDITTYISNDVAIDPQNRGDYDDFLNSLHPSSLPPHKLALKPNCPIMLLRNLSPMQGLCNGTRLICKELINHTIVAEIATGPYAGTTTLLQKILLECSSEDRCAIPFKRYQFPVRLCFTMTINKAQGQTLDRVGVYLREPVFSHGQLYVALSRAKKAASVKVIIVPPTFADTSHCTTTRNVVYREIYERVAEQ